MTFSIARQSALYLKLDALKCSAFFRRVLDHTPIAHPTPNEMASLCPPTHGAQATGSANGHGIGSRDGHWAGAGGGQGAGILDCPASSSELVGSCRCDGEPNRHLPVFPWHDLAGISRRSTLRRGYGDSDHRPRHIAVSAFSPPGIWRTDGGTGASLASRSGRWSICCSFCVECSGRPNDAVSDGNYGRCGIRGMPQTAHKAAA